MPAVPRCRCAVQLEEMRKNEDPRLSFSTPEFKEAQRIFTDNFKVCHCDSATACAGCKRPCCPRC